MNTSLSRSAASASVGAAAILRLFYGLMIDAPEVYNGAWLSALIGLALTLPVLWMMKRAAGRPLLLLALLLIIALDAGAMVEATAFSESCVALNHIPTVVLALPLLLAAGRCIWLGGNAIGDSARVWMRSFVPLLALVVVVQAPYYRPMWIFPILGFGVDGILRGGVRAAGWMVTLGGAAMTLCEDARFSKVCRRLSVAVVVATLLILLRLMMAPVMDAAGLSRRVQLDALLTNGRAPMVLQLPMIAIYFVGMLHLICFEVWAATALLRRIFPKSKLLISGGMVLLFVILAALWPVSDIWRLPALLLAAIPLKREAATCAG